MAIVNNIRCDWCLYPISNGIIDNNRFYHNNCFEKKTKPKSHQDILDLEYNKLSEETKQIISEW